MKTFFLLDENITFELIQLIESFGFLVEHIKKIGKTGIENGEIYKYAEVKNMWIITRDTDFQNREKFNKFKIGGIIQFNLDDSNTENLTTYMRDVMDKFGNEFNIKRLIIVNNDGFDIYP